MQRYCSYTLISQNPRILEAAEKEQRSVVEQRKNELPQGHRLVRSALNNLALIIQASGETSDLEKALNIYDKLICPP